VVTWSPPRSTFLDFGQRRGDTCSMLEGGNCATGRSLGGNVLPSGTQIEDVTRRGTVHRQDVGSSTTGRTCQRHECERLRSVVGRRHHPGSLCAIT
jgi:hypothetical protein